ncbi:Uncharacterised protein [Algoriella xinjiangensis]|uniref:hypothetical protein n=1 Tax=Algoriella xinjiangensis TaxID=684065 RepID=UPI000F6435DA|nr:hypothetical protein [Algoriella xinjiangensis]VDH16852.1 Uncharacterised protein [Algoriella xinjiangensis]
MKKLLFTSVLFLANFILAQTNEYYSLTSSFSAGSEYENFTCSLKNKEKFYDSYKNDTIKIISREKCNYGHVYKIVYKGKLMYSDFSIGLIKKKGVDKDFYNNELDRELSKVNVETQIKLIEKYKKVDSIKLSIKEAELKIKEAKDLEATEKYNNFPCESISYSKDKFTGEKMWETQYNEFITIEKHIKNTSTAYYFSLFYYDNFLTIPPKNTALILLFSDGTKLTKYDDVNVDYIDSDKGYQYHFFTSLNSNDLKILGSKKITDYKLYIFSSEFDKVASERLMKQTKCLVFKK